MVAIGPLGACIDYVQQGSLTTYTQQGVWLTTFAATLPM